MTGVTEADRQHRREDFDLAAVNVMEEDDV
jgi:hypothetical protein